MNCSICDACLIEPFEKDPPKCGECWRREAEAMCADVERLLLENRLLRECLLGVQLRKRCLVDGPEGDLLEMCDVPWEEVFREKMAAALSPRKEG